MIPAYPQIKICNFLDKLDDKIRVIIPDNYLITIHNDTGATYKEIANLLELPESVYRLNVNCGKNPSISILKKLQTLQESIFDILFQKKLSFMARREIATLPTRITPKLAYFVGYLQADGYVGSDKRRYGFSDEYIEHVRFMNILNKDLFGKLGKIRLINTKLGKKPHPLLEIKQNVVNSYLHTVFGINRGIKENLKIPKMFYQNKIILKWYLRGLFDGDGTLPKNPKQAKQLFVDITLKDKKFIEEIKEALRNIFGIQTLQIYNRIHKSPSSSNTSTTWELRIRKHSEIRKFLKRVGFHHCDKARRAREILKMPG